MRISTLAPFSKLPTGFRVRLHSYFSCATEPHLTRGRWLLAGSAFVVTAIAVGIAGFLRQPALPAQSPPPPASFDRALVTKGEGLAHVANCVGCHTVAGGKPFSGGRPLHTPFGTIYATNITPDAKTGIGQWSRAAFARALREGVRRDGDFLYPAFPYDHFTRTTDADLDALYAFLMTRPAIVAETPANNLVPPLQFRPLVAGWNLLYLRQGPSDDSDRGRYLAEGLAHCGACHTPRDRLGAEIAAQAYDGAWTDGWHAPALNGHSPAVRAWTADELFSYLRTGFSATHAAAAGPMGEVTRELALAPEADARALAGYFADLMASAPGAHADATVLDKRAIDDQGHPEGAALFAGACAACHETGAPMMQQGRPPLSWGTSLQDEAPNNVLHVIARGLAPPAGHAGPAMPAFADDFTDRQLGEIAAYLRARFTDRPPWQDVEHAAGQVRTGGGP